MLSLAKLDAIGQQWVASLAPYNFSLHYNPGRQNVVADSLSRIPWENLFYQDSLDFNVIKVVIDKGEVNTTACIEPDVLEEKLTLQVHQLVNSLTGKMMKQQWKHEQKSDSEIAPVLNLVKQNKHLQNQIQRWMKQVRKFCYDLEITFIWLMVYCTRNGFTKKKWFTYNLFFQGHFLRKLYWLVMITLVT